MCRVRVCVCVALIPNIPIKHFSRITATSANVLSKLAQLLLLPLKLVLVLVLLFMFEEENNDSGVVQVFAPLDSEDDDDDDDDINWDEAVDISIVDAATGAVDDNEEYAVATDSSCVCSSFRCDDDDEYDFILFSSADDEILEAGGIVNEEDDVDCS